MKAGEIKFQCYTGVANSKNTIGVITLDGIKARMAEASITENVDAYRKTKDTKYKKRILCITPMGRCMEGENRRELSKYEDSGLTMIDLDHLTKEQMESIKEKLSDDDKMAELGVVMAYVTVSGEGIRIIFRDFKGVENKMAGALAFLKIMGFPVDRWDAQCRDLTRCSILSKYDDIIFCLHNEDEVNQYDATEFEYNLSEDEVASMVKADKNDLYNATRLSVNKASDYDGTPYMKYTDAQIRENDETYKNYQYKGRRVAGIVQDFITYKSQGQGPEDGQKHALYNLMCRYFRSLVDMNPRVLHAVLPEMNNPLRETWEQCVYYCQKGKNSSYMERPFYLWLQKGGYLDTPATAEEQTVEDVKTAQYKEFINNCPPLPPIIAEYFKIAPLYFKLPVLFAAEGILALYATNYRANYFDGLPISTTFYTLIYGPAACGKSFMKRLDPLLEQFIIRDQLSNMKMNWYNELCQRSKQTDLPEKPKVKTVLIPSRASAGEICNVQQNIGQHHWLQMISEFSVWSTNVMKSSSDLSGMYRIGYDNDRFGQQFMSANTFRGTVNLFPIVLATCTEGQIDAFFKNTEDGLVTRFDYIPILNQDFADWEEWKTLSLRDLQRIEKTTDRLLSTIYKDPEAPDVNLIQSKDLKEKSNWDYDYLPPVTYDVSWMNAPLRNWLRQKLDEAKLDGNKVASQLRKRSARKAFAYGLLCFALWGKDDKLTRQKVIDNMLWMAEISFFFTRVKWEQVMLDKDVKAPERARRSGRLIDQVSDEFTLAELDAAIRQSGKKTDAKQMIRVWKSSNYIKEIDNSHYTKTTKL